MVICDRGGVVMKKKERKRQTEDKWKEGHQGRMNFYWAFVVVLMISSLFLLVSKVFVCVCCVSENIFKSYLQEGFFSNKNYYYSFTH